MQYILTEEEFKELKEKQQAITKLGQQQLQKLCTKIAETMPDYFWENEEAHIWGCVLTNTAAYCDECPVISICPARKRYSK